MPLYIAERECTRKHSHSTRREAKRIQKLMQERTGQQFKRYLCRFCGNYHIAHRMPEGMREDTDQTSNETTE